MRGHLQHRGDDAWRLKVFLGRDAAGKRRYIERTVHGPRREAERELARLVVEVDDGRHVASAPMTIRERLDRWLAFCPGALGHFTLVGPSCRRVPTAARREPTSA